MGKLYLIGNAHLDPVWLWRWQEGYTEVLNTFRSALDRMKDFDDFKFTSACAVYYQWIEQADPEMFEEIRQRVKEGRWEIAGGWFLQPDCNIPCGESFARHGLVSQRYFKEKFGVTAKTGYNVDSFGHNPSIPQMLKKSGMDNYVFMRPMPHENPELDDVFRWQSPDGSCVNVYRIPWYYNFMMDNFECYQKLQDKSDADGRDYMAFCGVGNHGGGPSIRLLHEIKKLNLPQAEFSTLEEYFENGELGELKTFTRPLRHHARGCYSACSFAKKNNRKCEQNLIAAEKFATLAEKLCGLKYPKNKLNKAWKNLMFNQFHDILAGCAIKSAYDDAGYLYGETMSITEQIINLSLQRICRNIDTLQGNSLPAYKRQKQWKTWEHEVLGTPVVVFNPHSWEVSSLVHLNVDAAKVCDVHGKEVPMQMIRGEQTNVEDKYNTAFMATVPPYGYSVYRFFIESPSRVEFENTLKISQTSIENEKIRVEFDEASGEIKSFYVKAEDRYIISEPCESIFTDESKCDTWAHDEFDLGEDCGKLGRAEFQILESGPVRAVLRVKSYGENTCVRRDYICTAGSELLQVKTWIDFREKHKALKFAFPMQKDMVTAHMPYGTVDLPSGTGEEVCQEFIACGDLCVANDCKYGYDAKGGKMRLTILRGAIYADHFGKRDDLCEYMEQGIHEFNYAILPYRSKTQAQKASAELNFPMRWVADGFHGGELAEEMSCIACDAEDVIVTAVKKAEDDDGYVLRFYESEGQDGNATVKLFDNRIDTAIGHNEIKTFKITDQGTKEVNLIEW